MRVTIVFSFDAWYFVLMNSISHLSEIGTKIYTNTWTDGLIEYAVMRIQYTSQEYNGVKKGY
jgi:hypothetical protein